MPIKMPRRREPVEESQLWSQADSKIVEQAFSRASKQSTHSLLSWAETCLNAMGKGFDDYRETSDIQAIGEIGEGLLAMYAIVIVLKTRSRT
jgi:hypothetical protein